jgi:SAF domain
VTATLTRTRPVKAPDTTQLRLEPQGIKRRPLLAVASAVLVAVSVATFASLYLRAGHQQSVLAVAQPVQQGQVLTGSDLKVVRISLGSGISSVSATAADRVVGRPVTVALEPGALLTPSDLARGLPVPPGDAIVGVALKSGQLPASGVVPGEDVDVVMTGPQDSPYTASGTTSTPGTPVYGAVSGPGTILAPDVLVSDVAVPSASSGSDTVVVSLVVPRALAPIIASASVAGQAALVVIASGS